VGAEASASAEVENESQGHTSRSSEPRYSGQFYNHLYRASCILHPQSVLEGSASVAQPRHPSAQPRSPQPMSDGTGAPSVSEGVPPESTAASLGSADLTAAAAGDGGEAAVAAPSLAGQHAQGGEPPAAPEPEVEPAPDGPESDPATSAAVGGEAGAGEKEPQALTEEQRAEAEAAARILREKEANKQAREEARQDEERRLAEQAAAEEEKLARQKRLEEGKKARQARRAAKMKKRQEEMNKERELRIISQYCLTKENKRLGKMMRIALDDLRVFRMTEKKMETLELKKGHMVTTGEYNFDDPQFSARPVPGTTDQVSITVTTGKKAKAKEKIYVCGDRPSLLQDLAFAIFKANMMEPRRFQCRKYTRNDR
jgi:hypothetical protein